ncbi:MAG TPA: hypothetical protein VN903_01350, partial [Polyangia bacterium]|nr:hypothetical protein [Polyangia bacterium]
MAAGVNRSSFVAYEKRGRATHYISKSGHRIEVTCSGSDRRLGACVLLVVINYALFALDGFRDGELSFGAIYSSAIILVLSPVWWLAAMTLWRRFRIDIDRDRIVLRERTLVPWGRTMVRPLGEFLGMSTRPGFLGRSRFFFEFAPRPGWLAPTLWVSADQFEAIRGWIWNAAKEMADGPPVFAAQEDDGERAVIGSTDLGPGL